MAKSIVGAGVFTHEAGIHVDGLLKDPLNYQGVDPQEVGRQHQFILGKHPAHKRLFMFMLNWASLYRKRMQV
ncbi:MAG: hypothetical protein R3E08_01670 [Thiotrichaceae bacterium]